MNINEGDHSLEFEGTRLGSIQLAQLQRLARILKLCM